MINTVLFLFF